MQPGLLRYVPTAARRQMEQELEPLMNGRWALGVGRWALGVGSLVPSGALHAQ